jgi:hypothetical protein
MKSIRLLRVLAAKVILETHGKDKLGERKRKLIQNVMASVEMVGLELLS